MANPSIGDLTAEAQGFLEEYGLRMFRCSRDGTMAEAFAFIDGPVHSIENRGISCEHFETWLIRCHEMKGTKGKGNASEKGNNASKGKGNRPSDNVGTPAPPVPRFSPTCVPMASPGTAATRYWINVAKKAILEATPTQATPGAPPPDTSAWNRALELLEPPVNTEKIAQAFDDIRAARTDPPQDNAEAEKTAAMAVRQALVLDICGTAGTLSDSGFIAALESAFGRPLSPELRSQLFLTRTAIGRLGRDPATFMSAAPHLFSGALSDQEMVELFPAYENCADGLKRVSPNEPSASSAP